MNRQLEFYGRNAENINIENLKKIISDNKNTEFGKKYSFSDIKSVSDYRSNVPVTDYSDYYCSIQKMRIDNKNLLTNYPVEGYCRTSGSEGNIKYIPVTAESLRRYSNWTECYKNKIIKQNGGMRLFINTFRTELNDEKIIREILFSEIYYRYMCRAGLLNTDEYIGGKNFLFDKNAENILFAKVWASFLFRDITSIEAVFQYDILNFFSYMEKNWRTVIKSIRNGKIPDNINLSDKMQTVLFDLRYNNKDNNRLDKVEYICNQGFENIALRLWNKLSLLSGISSNSFFAENTALERYTGNIPRYYLCYCASECFMGIPVHENDFGFVLLPQNGFFEFIPYNSESSDTFLPHELTCGKLYEIIITNFSGLYRYKLGDVLEVKGFYFKSPVLEFKFRKNQALNLAGEKVSVRQLEYSVKILQEKYPIEGFCFGTSVHDMPGIYYIITALSGKEKYNSCQIAESWDKIMCRLNTDYQDLRKSEQLGMPEVFCVESDELSDILSEYISSQRHNKPLHILPQIKSDNLFKELKIRYEKIKT